MFLDQVPPDTSSYMIAGYAIFLVLSTIYLASLAIRSRNLNRDLLTLKSLEEEQQQEAAARQAATPAPRKTRASRAKSNKPKQTQKKTVRKR